MKKKPQKPKQTRKSTQGLHFRIVSVWNEWEAGTLAQLFSTIIKLTRKSIYSCKILACNSRDLSWFNTKIIQSSSTPVLGHFMTLDQLLKDSKESTVRPLTNPKFMSEKSSLKHMVHFEKSGFIVGGRRICTEKDNESCSVLHNISINIKSLLNNMQNFEISWHLMKEMGTKYCPKGQQSFQLLHRINLNKEDGSDQYTRSTAFLLKAFSEILRFL